MTTNTSTTQGNIDIEVKSAGFAVGNHAEIHVNGELVEMPHEYFRGYNVAVIDAVTGAVIDRRRYDTVGIMANADALAEFLNTLPPNSLVAVAVKDDGGLNLSDNLRQALRGIGSTAIDRLAFRNSWAIIGRPKSEQGTAVEQLSTTTSVSFRQSFPRLPAPFQPPGVAISIRSAGLDLGNLAEIQLNGTTVSMPNGYGRGMNVVVVNEMNGKVVDRRVFDLIPNLAMAAEFAKFVEDIPSGRIVLIAAKDDVSINLSEDAKSACRSIGSLQIDQLGLRNSWAIGGRKGASSGSAVEMLSAIDQVHVLYHFPFKLDRVTSRSSLTQDYVGSSATAGLKTQPVYRTSISVSPATSLVDIRASRETTVEINGQTHTINARQSARVAPNGFHKVSVSIPAQDLTCPTLTLNTDLMESDKRHPVTPDVEVHKKIVSLKDGDLHRAREQLGVPATFSETDLNHMQTALRNLSKTVQYTYNKTPHGVHHDRGVVPSNMQHPHFKMDFGGGGAVYAQLDPSDVPGLTTGARQFQGEADTGLFESATRIVVHTVEKVGGGIVQTAENIGSDAVRTVEQVGEDLVHGDVGYIGQHLHQGGENLGEDILNGAGEVVAGSHQLAIVTIHTAAESVRFALTHTGDVGKVIGWLFEKIKVELTKAIDWLMDKIDWQNVLHTHDKFSVFFTSKIEDVKTYPAMLKQRSDKFFASHVEKVQSDITHTLQRHDVLAGIKQVPPSASHSGAMEKIEWLFGKLAENAAAASSLGPVMLTFEQDDRASSLVTLVETKFGKDGEKILDALRQAGVDVESVFTDPNHGLDYLLGAFLKLAEAAAIFSLDGVAAIFDALMDLLEGSLDTLKRVGKQEMDIPFVSDLYEAVTEDRQLTLLSLSALAVAIPTTILYEAEFHSAPFPEETAGAAPARARTAPTLTPLSTLEKGFAFGYASCHVVLALTSLADDSKSLIKALIPSGTAHDPAEPLSNFDAIVTFTDLIVGLIAQITGTPIPPSEPDTLPEYVTRLNVFEAPSLCAHEIWYYQWGAYWFNLILKFPYLGMRELKLEKKSVQVVESALTIGNAAIGLGHLGLMAYLDRLDRTKDAALRDLTDPTKSLVNMDDLKLYQELENSATEVFGSTLYHDFTNPGDPELAKWVAEIRNYHEWTKIDTAIAAKGFGNVMDTFPEIGQAGALPALVKKTEGYSFIGTMAGDVGGHGAEAITYFARSSTAELL